MARRGRRRGSRRRPRARPPRGHKHRRHGACQGQTGRRRPWRRLLTVPRRGRGAACLSRVARDALWQRERARCRGGAPRPSPLNASSAPRALFCRGGAGRWGAPGALAAGQWRLREPHATECCHPRCPRRSAPPPRAGLVRVKLERQLAVRLLDVIVVGALGHAQDLIGGRWQGRCWAAWLPALGTSRG